MRVYQRKTVIRGKEQPIWWIDVRVPVRPGEKRKKRIRLRSPIQTKKGALDYARQVLEEKLDPNHIEKKEVPTMEEFAPRFMTAFENNSTLGSVRCYNIAIQTHILPAFGKKRLDEIGEVELEEFKAVLRNKTGTNKQEKLKPTTINRVLNTLVRILNVAREWKIISTTPRTKQLKVLARQPVFLTFEQAEMLLGSGSPASMAMLVSLKAGLRVGETMGLKWSDVDFQTNIITVNRKILLGVESPPKSHKPRTIAMPGSLAKTLREYQKHANGDYIISRPSGRRVLRTWLVRELVKDLKGIGVELPKGVKWHALRHTYASHLAMKGVPLKAVQELLGHSSIETTMIYAHLSPDSIQSAVQVLDQSTVEQKKGHCRDTMLL